MSWTAPASEGSSAVTDYKLTGTTSATVTASATSFTITGLGNGVQECEQVQAVNQVGGSALSSQACATTPAPPGAVSSLSVTGGDNQLTVSWGSASGAASYEVTVGGSTQSTTSTSITVGATAWTSETVKVYAVNSVGDGPTTTGSGAAWTRSGTVTCVDSLSGDRSIQNDCSNVGSGTAWSQTSDSVAINWIDPQGHLGTLGGNFEWLCSTYYTGSVSGDVYAIVSSPSESACTSALPSYQSPDTPHVIAAVSSSSLGSGSQHICEYQGTTTGANGSFDSEELSPCGTVPSGLSGASEVNNFYT